MTRYLFGYLFVRIAKIIAVLILLGGLVGAGVRYAQGTLETGGVRYEPSSAAGAKLFALGTEWSRMRELVAAFLGQSAPPTTVVSLSNAPSTPAEFVQLSELLKKLQSERDKVKTAVVERFETLVTEIERKLRAHASSLAESKASAPKSDTKPPAPDESGLPKAKTLFDSLSRAEVAARRNLLTESHEFISLLKTSAENPQNAATLTRALDELANLERLLPTNLEIATKNPPPSDPPKRAPSTPKFAAEKIADQLDQARRLVRSALLTDWSVDLALAAAVAEVEREQKRSLEASRELQRLWLSVITFIAVLVLGSALTAFLILVLADLTQAFLDTARNTGVVAAAHQIPSLANEGDVEQ